MLFIIWFLFITIISFSVLGQKVDTYQYILYCLVLLYFLYLNEQLK